MEFSEALKVLKLKPDFSEDELKKAYKSAAKKNHPDLGGSEEMMKVINEAKNTLEDYLEDISKNGGNRTQNYNTAQNNATKHTNTNANARQNRNYYNQDYWRTQGNGDRAYNRQSSVFEGFEEFFRQANKEYNSQYESSNTSKTSNKASTTGTKSTNRETRDSDIRNFEEVLSKLIDNTVGEQKYSALMNLIARMFISSLLAILIFYAINIFITSPNAIGAIWSILRTLYKIAIPVTVLNIAIKSIKRYKEDLKLKPTIKITHSFNNYGTWLTVYLHGKKIASFLISNTNYENLWDRMQEAWYNISISTVSCVMSHGKKKEFIKMPNTNWSSSGTKYKFFEFGNPYICIDFIDGPGFIIVTPVGFVVYNGKRIKFLSMDKLTLTVKYTKGTGELGKTALYNAIISDGTTGFTVIYSLANNMWSYLIL